VYRRSVRDGLKLGLLSLLFLTPRFAPCAPNDAAAQKLRDRAVEEDYTARDYAAAERRLRDALSLCEKTSDCSPFIRARLHCDLGVIDFLRGTLDLARTEFATAIVEDPNILVDPKLSSPEVQREFAAVKLENPPPVAPASPAHGNNEDTAQSRASDGRMAEAGDCPPAFPGCHNEEPGKSCDSREDCAAGEECVERACRSLGKEEERARDLRRNWLSLGIQAELLFMPGADDACLGDRNYTCFLSSTGEYYSEVPAKGVDDQVIAGLAGAPMIRIHAGYDRAVLPNLTLGGRLGYALFGGGPQRPAHNATAAGPSFLPIHVEVRLAYFFGKNVLAQPGARFFVAVGGGMTEVDASATIQVVRPGLNTSPFSVDAWTKTGLGFVALGPGVMYAVAPNQGPVLDAKAILLFPTAGVALAAQLGYAFGF
jgi:hypothetical protein